MPRLRQAQECIPDQKLVQVNKYRMGLSITQLYLLLFFTRVPVQAAE